MGFFPSVDLAPVSSLAVETVDRAAREKLNENHKQIFLFNFSAARPIKNTMRNYDTPTSGKSPFPTTYIYEYADENEC